MIKVIQLIAAAWLLVVAAFFYGVKATENGWWPYPLLQEFEDFVSGHEEEGTTLTEKVANDLGLVPARHLVPTPPLEQFNSAYGFLDVPTRDRRGKPVVFLSPAAPPGYRLIYGVFDFTDHLHGAILIGPDGKVERVWQISQENLEWPSPQDDNVFPHGVEILADGSLIVAYDHGTSLTRYDWCGNEEWRLKGGFHHSVELLDQDSLWVWGNEGRASQFGEYMHQVRTADGEIVRTATILDTIDANPGIDIFGVRQADYEQGSRWVMGGGDPFHPNDVDPLPAGFSDAYPRFQTGDLLISLRSLNLLYVVDPATLEVKWWRQGITRRQHDPDWNARGTITVFDNNMHRDHSHIIEIDPETFETRRLIDGRDHDFYSWHRGKHQLLESGHVLVTSSAQGRVFEVAPDGSLTFDFLNLYTPDQGALVVSEARYLPMNYFEELPVCDR